MGVNVSAVSGFAIKSASIKERVATLLGERGRGDPEELFDELGLNYWHAGSSYTGDVRVLLLFQPHPKHVDDQIFKWLSVINKKLGVNLTTEDVEFTSDTYWC